MTKGSKLSRRKALVVAGAASLGALLVRPSPALASKFTRLDKAIVDMREARDYLKDAPDKFGGHKKKAIEALNGAISEIEAAIKFAEK